ncbi:hypothetical protein Lal_00023360, partial [Lupinus albus]
NPDPLHVRNVARRDPYYSPSLQASRLAKFQGRKQAYICYATMPWMVEKGFEFAHNLEVQGANTFIEMSGKIYPTLIQEFIAIFNIRKGELTKAGSLTIESRLLHYLIAYILVQHNTNHVQPTINDLKLMKEFWLTTLVRMSRSCQGLLHLHRDCSHMRSLYLVLSTTLRSTRLIWK